MELYEPVDVFDVTMVVSTDSPTPNLTSFPSMFGPTMCRPASCGGGAISVESAALEAMAAQVSSAAAGTSSARGSLSGAASAAAGCQEPAAGTFLLLQSLLAGALACLDECAASLSSATSSASGAYTVTDATQMPGTIESCPAAP